MGLRHLRSLLVAAFFLLPVAVAAQMPTTRPTPEQARILLQTRPDLVAQLRQRFVTSGHDARTRSTPGCAPKGIPRTCSTRT